MSRRVGVAPGTTTFQLGTPAPDKRLVLINPWVGGELQLGGLSRVPTQARIRWDLIGLMGGGSLIVALAAGLIASALD